MNAITHIQILSDIKWKHAYALLSRRAYNLPTLSGKKNLLFTTLNLEALKIKPAMDELFTFEHNRKEYFEVNGNDKKEAYEEMSASDEVNVNAHLCMFPTLCFNLSRHFANFVHVYIITFLIFSFFCLIQDKLKHLYEGTRNRDDPERDLAFGMLNADEKQQKRDIFQS